MTTGRINQGASSLKNAYAQMRACNSRESSSVFWCHKSDFEISGTRAVAVSLTLDLFLFQFDPTTL